MKYFWKGINQKPIVSDLTYYLLFIPINFTLDIVLIVKMKKALLEKLNLEVKKEKEILFDKTLAFTFLLLNFLMKSPQMLKSIFDMVHVNGNLVNRESFGFSYYVLFYKWYCIYSRICPTYDDKLAFILFIISLLTNSFFFFLFDKNLKFGFRVAFSKLTSSKKSNNSIILRLLKIFIIFYAYDKQKSSNFSYKISISISKKKIIFMFVNTKIILFYSFLL